MDYLDVAMTEYQSLRSEISSSLSNQHSITNVGIASVGVVFAFGSSQWQNGVIVDVIFFLLIPIIVHFVTLAWNGEINRIARAGRFLQSKEQVVNDVLRKSYPDYPQALMWENWLRQQASPTTKKIRKTKWNYYAILGLFTLLNITSVILGLFHLLQVTRGLFLVFLPLTAINLLFMMFHFVLFRRIKR